MSAIACSILQLSVPIFRINVFLSAASRLEGRGTSVAAGGLSTTHGELMLNQCFFLLSILFRHTTSEPFRGEMLFKL